METWDAIIGRQLSPQGWRLQTPGLVKSFGALANRSRCTMLMVLGCKDGATLKELHTAAKTRSIDAHMRALEDLGVLEKGDYGQKYTLHPGKPLDQALLFLHFLAGREQPEESDQAVIDEPLACADTERVCYALNNELRLKFCIALRSGRCEEVRKTWQGKSAFSRHIDVLKDAELIGGGRCEEQLIRSPALLHAQHIVAKVTLLTHTLKPEEHPHLLSSC